MTIVPLSTYLKMHRKRSGLTHDELAFLLGSMRGTSVSRHESGQSLPQLRTALMYEAVFGAAIRELFEGVFAEAREAVNVRAVGMLAYFQKKPRSRKIERKIEVLKAIVGEEDNVRAA
ncbi:MAG: helix-turn-helix protein [Bryobacterales bacterium]|nr:helix-turn-helix protein [Bryobacterales bacterium]